jgi:hypothetical protein
MPALLSVIPTTDAVEAAWQRHADLLGQAVDNSAIMLNREYRERLALSEKEWKEAFLIWAKYA